MRFLYLILALLSIVAFVRGGKTSKKEKNVCKLPLKKGSGKRVFPRFYYNKEQKKCKPFDYGGQGGNGNNFETFKACNKECVCDQPMKPGIGLAIDTRFYYNRNLGDCLLFNLGGGKGNANNFRSLKDCLNACGKLPEYVCKLPMKKGRGKGSFPRFYYNREEKKCKPFDYRGQGGNDNNFETFKACNKECVCDQPMKIGNGLGIDTRFYYSRFLGGCLRFIFGGGKGNANNFKSEKKCRKACVGNSKGGKPSTTRKPSKGKKTTKGKKPSNKGKNVCKQRMKAGEGSGKGKKRRFYYNQEKQRCLKFNYQGKGGNGNNFKNIEACNMKCVCGQPMEKGKGSRKRTRWYYNKKRNECKQFKYGGKNGNANNFENRKACSNACLKKKKV